MPAIASILVRSNLVGSAVAPPAAGDRSTKELFFSLGGFTAGSLATYVAGVELAIFDGTNFQPLVSGGINGRQVEREGAQTIVGRKTFGLPSLSITGGVDGQVLTTDGGGNLRWDAGGGGGGPSYTWGRGLTESIPGTVDLNIANNVANDPTGLGGVWTNPVGPANGLVIAVTGAISLAPASDTQFGGIVVPPNGGLTLTGGPPALAIDPATMAEAITGLNPIKPISPLVLKLGADPASLLTTNKSIIPAINEIATILGTVAGLVFVGTFDPRVLATEVSPITGSPLVAGPLPVATQNRLGFMLLVSDPGTPQAGSNAPQVAMMPNDMLMCVEAPLGAGTYAWGHARLGQITITASQVGITAIPPLTATNVQQALEELQANKLDAPLWTDTSLSGIGSQLDPLKVAIVDGGSF